MPSCTAQMLIGRKATPGVGLEPTHLMLFAPQENNWTLIALPDSQSEGTSAAKKITWTTSEEHAIEDGLLMAAVYLFEDGDLLQLIKESTSSPVVDISDPSKQFGEHVLAQLRNRCRNVEGDISIVLTLFADSVLLGQARNLNEFAMDIEVCLSPVLHQTSVRI